MQVRAGYMSSTCTPSEGSARGTIAPSRDHSTLNLRNIYITRHMQGANRLGSALAVRDVASVLPYWFRSTPRVGRARAAARSLSRRVFPATERAPVPLSGRRDGSVQWENKKMWIVRAERRAGCERHMPLDRRARARLRRDVTRRAAAVPAAATSQWAAAAARTLYPLLHTSYLFGYHSLATPTRPINVS